MRKMARMHAAKTRTFDDPLKGLEVLRVIVFFTKL